MQQCTLDPTANVVPIVEARVEQTADLRGTAAQWALADGGLPANCEVLADGGVRLRATAGAAVGSTVQNAWFRPREPGNTGGTYFDPIGGFNARLTDQFVGIRGQWNGTAANVAYSQVQAWLNPRFDTTKPKLINGGTWQLVIYQIVYHFIAGLTGSNLYFTLAPVARAQMDATTEAAGWVVFTFKDSAGIVTPWHPDRYSAPVIANSSIGTIVGSDYFITCYGNDSKGNRVTNVAWGYDNTQTVFSAGGAGNNVSLQAAAYGHYFAGQPSLGAFNTPAGLPALQFIPVTHAAATTVTFSTNPIDLGIATTDASLVEFQVQAEVPLGTSVVAGAAVDPVGGGSYTTFVSGQSAKDVSLAAARKYDVRVTLTPNAANDRTPIVRLLGARLVARTDLGNLVEVIELNEHTDPITHQSEIESCTIRCYHDGDRDYRDPISLLLSQNPPGQFSFRLYVGDRRLTRDQWVYHDDFYPQDVDLQEAYTDIHCVSCLSQLRQELPVLSSDAVAAPTVTSSNPGVWTASSGTDLAAQIADLPEPQWAATTSYLIGQRIIDANSNVQIATTDGTSGGSAPTWNATNGGYTVDSTVTWQNLGALLSGLPDDTTYIQSPNNPVNADYIVTLGKIGTPSQSVGATIQCRAATVGAAQTLTLRIQLREGTTVRAFKDFTVNVQDAGQGSYTAFQYLLTAAEQATIGNWGNLNFLIRANGTGGIRVGFARLVVLGRRAPYVSSAIGTTAQSIMDDLINNQVALDARLKGPQYANTSPAIIVSKTIEQDASGTTDLLRSLDELQRLAWITGTFYQSTQGRFTNRPFYQVVTGTDLITGTVTASFAPLVGPVRAILNPAEVEPLSITPGWRQRIPLYRVPWGWDGKNWGGEAQVINAPALTYYRPDLIEADPRCPTETAKWISGQGLGNGLSARHGQMFGLGLMEWRFRCTYPHPEWERGDVITIPTDRFLAYDPIGTRSIAGKVWASGVIVGRHDALGREWSIWIQSLSAIRPITMATAGPPVNSLSGQGLAITQASEVWRANELFVQYVGTSSVKSVKIATSTSSFPAAGTGTAFDGTSGLADVGAFTLGQNIYVTITPYTSLGGVDVSGFAYQFQTRCADFPYVDIRAHQMLPNAGFEDGLIFVVGGTGATAVITDSTKAHSGNKYLQVTSTTGASAYAAGADDAGAVRYFEVSPGDVVQWGGYAYRESGTDNVSILLQTRDKDRNFVANIATPNQNTAAYVLVQGELTIPAGVKYVAMNYYCDGSGTGTVARFDDVFLRLAFGSSTHHNPQGSIPPTAAPTNFFSWATGGPAGGQMWVSWGWTSQTAYRADGSSISIPAPPAAPAAPTLGQVAGGALAARTRWARIAYVKDGRLYPVSAESSFAISVNNLLKITSPTNPGGYDAWAILVGSATNTEFYQTGNQAFGSDWTEPTTGFVSNLSPWSASWKSITTVNYVASTTIYDYGCYDPTLGFVRIFGGAVTPDAQNAAKQNGDGKVPLSFGAMTATIPAGASSSSGNGGGGKYL